MTNRQLLSSILSLTVLCGAAYSQWLTLGGEIPINPNSGAVISPEFAYSSSGDFWLYNSAGANGVVDSTDNSMLGGDDVGMISFSISCRADPGNALQATLPSFGDGIAWAPPVVDEGELRLIGQGFSGAFLPISDQVIPIFHLAPDTGVQDFASATNEIEITVGIKADGVATPKESVSLLHLPAAFEPA